MIASLFRSLRRLFRRYPATATVGPRPHWFALSLWTSAERCKRQRLFEAWDSTLRRRHPKTGDKLRVTVRTTTPFTFTDAWEMSPVAALEFVHVRLPDGKMVAGWMELGTGEPDVILIIDTYSPDPHTYGL